MSRENLLTNEIRVYRENAAALRTAKETITKFDGKVYNKRLDTALNETTLPEGIEVRFTTYQEYGQFKVRVFNANRSFKGDLNSYGEPTWCYVTNDTAEVRIGKLEEVFELTDTYKYKIKADTINEMLEKHAEYLEKCASSLEYALENQETIVNEFQEICNAFTAFNHKYDYNIREMLGILYSLQYNGSSNLKEYRIKTY